MSSKEIVIAWVQQLPDNLGVPDILSALQDRYAAGPSQSASADADYEWPAPDVTEEEWRQFVARGLRRELEDPREDIYSLDEGGPANEQR